MTNPTRRNFLKVFPALEAMVATGNSKAIEREDLPPLPFRLDKGVPYYAIPKYAWCDQRVNYELRTDPDIPLTTIEALDQYMGLEHLKLYQAHGYSIEILESHPDATYG